MSDLKYSTITVVIEERIRQEVYKYRLPNTLDLAAEFAVSRQTITNALRPLTSAGLLKSCGKKGMLICRTPEKKRGIIAVVSFCNIASNTLLPADDRFFSLFEEADFEMMRIGLPYSSRFGNPELFLRFAQDVSGLIFISSSLTLEMAQYLEKLNKPFISCNQLPVYPRLNYVENDDFSQIREVITYLKKRNYRKIALYFPSPLECYGKLVKKSYRKLMTELELPIHHCFTGDSSYLQNPQAAFRKFSQEILQGDQPDLILLWSCSMGSKDEDYQPLQELCGRNIPVLLRSNYAMQLGLNYPDLYFLDCKNPSEALMKAALQGLQELIIARPEKPIHRLIPNQVTCPDIPDCKNA